MKSIEIYPYVVVYKNMFKDIDKTYNVLESSITSTVENKVFEDWQQWSSFGTYLNPISKKINWDIYDINTGIKILNQDSDLDQSHLIVELMNNFDAVSNDYISRYNLDINIYDKVENKNGNINNLWKRTAPVICRYNMLSYENRKMTMRYHTDYVREPMQSPGYKFGITVLAYFNDDYVGGEIEFAIGNKVIKYKPEAGDFLLFPSGNPTFLTGEDVYLHGVHPITSGSNKLFLRMFWQRYEDGNQEWYDKENEFGVDQWGIQYQDMMKEYNKTITQKNFIENAIRIEPII